MTDTYIISTSGKATIIKDPDARLDYIWDWSIWLTDASDTISSHVMTAESGINVDSSAIVSGTVVAFISGGTAGTTYRASCRITTAGGRIDERSIFLKIVER